MNVSTLINAFSQKRLQPYINRFKGDTKKAVNLYKDNILLSESLYPSLSILEITLRNSIHNVLKLRFNDDYWFKNCLHDDVIFSNSVKEAEKKILQSKKKLSSDHIISALNFSFWTILFNSKYQNLLWKHLRLAFPNLPKNKRKRQIVASKLNSLRKLRNRIYHYEPICWNLKALDNHYISIIELINWLNEDIAVWVQEIDRFKKVLKELK